jgi:hypothetical protein
VSGCTLDGGARQMAGFWRLYLEVGVVCVHVVGGKRRCVSYMCSMVRCSVSSVSSEGRKGRAGVLHTRYISTPH